MLTDITKFNALRAQVAEYKEKNKILVFDYESPQGNKDARSHIFKLRKTKTMITEVHREVKAEALATCQAIDAEKRFLIGEIEGMIDVHDTPLKVIEQEKVRESLALFKAKEEARLAEEARIQKELEDREAEVARKEAEIKAREDAIKAEQERVYFEAEQAKRDKRVAQEAANVARREVEVRAAAEKKAIEDAAAQKIADAKAEALAKENTRLAKEAAAKAEQERLAEIERVRTENIHHREKIESDALISFNEVLNDITASKKVVNAIRDGIIDNVTINY